MESVCPRPTLLTLKGSKLEMFDTVFRERIRGLDAADWIPEEDDP